MEEKRRLSKFDKFGLIAGFVLLVLLFKACVSSGSSDYRSKSIYDAPDDVKQDFYEWRDNKQKGK